MRGKLLAGAALAAALAAGCSSAPAAESPAGPPATTPAGTAIASPPGPGDFVRVVDNPYYPLPVGRTLVYQGVRDGQTQTDRVHVTSRTRVIQGITATTVTDVATHNGKLLEKTTDWYAQDKRGNVWYLGEDTAAYLPGGKIDRSGSWQAGVNGGRAGLIMPANPQIPDAYRQEYLKGSAEDTAWVVNRGRSIQVPYGQLRRTLTTLEFTRLEPGIIDQKTYAPGIGIVDEVTVRGAQETARLVSVQGG